MRALLIAAMLVGCASFSFQQWQTDRLRAHIPTTFSFTPDARLQETRYSVPCQFAQNVPQVGVTIGGDYWEWFRTHVGVMERYSRCYERT